MTKIAKTLVLLAAALFTAAAHAQQYPSRPVRLIAPAAPGGSVDIVARLVAQRLNEALGQPVVVENRAGAGTNIGADLVAKSAPDGYTLLLGSSPALAANTHLYAKMTFDPLKDFAPIILIAYQPNVLVVPAALPVSNVQEFIALARSKPDGLTFGSGGAGNSQHISAELFMMSTGVSMVHVPYKGSAPALVDLLGGQINLMFDTVPTALVHIKSGKLKPLAVTTARRSGMLPNVPTMGEAGVAGFDFGGFLGLVAPAGTPREIVMRLNAEVQKALAGEMRAKLDELGLDIAGGTPDQMGAFMKDESAKYGRIVKAAKITPQ